MLSSGDAKCSKFVTFVVVVVVVVILSNASLVGRKFQFLEWYLLFESRFDILSQR
jgi:hypothetical protein